MNDAAIEAAVAHGIVDRDYHAELLGDLAHWVRLAGVTEADVLSPLSSVCGPRESEWVRDLVARSLGPDDYGLVYLGSYAGDRGADVGARMRAIGAAAMRHYIDARVRGLAEAVDEADEGSTPTVLLLLDAADDHGPAVQRRLGPMLLDRARRQMPTVLHLEQLAGSDRLLGGSAHSLVEAHYLRVTK